MQRLRIVLWEINAFEKSDSEDGLSNGIRLFGFSS